MTTVPLWQVDAFSAEPFGGNPAAVVLLAPGMGGMADAVRQAVAAEMNLAETAFVELMEGDAARAVGEHHASDTHAFEAGHRFRLRWFTPTREVPLCGHATLASAAVLAFELGNTSEALMFETLSGTLTVQVRGPGQLDMSLPAADPAAPLPAVLESGAAAQLSLLCACAGDLPVEDVRFTGPSLKYLLVVVAPGASGGGATAEQLQAIRPDFGAMRAAVAAEVLTGVIVAAAADPSSGYDVLSRFFAPWAGIDEDPVTGSAHAVLAPYFGQRLGRTVLRARQCSPRGGDVLMRVGEAGGPDQGRVVVSGSARVVLRGQLLL